MKTVLLNSAYMFICLTLAPQGAQRDDLKDKLTPQQEFFAKSIACSIAETKFAEQAVKQASDAEVRQFAQRVLDDHKRMHEEALKSAAGQRVAVVEGLEKDRREQLDRLSKLTGTEFDREYLRGVIERHEKAAEFCQAHTKDLKDETLRASVEKNLPAMKKHLEQARKLAGRVGAK